MSNIRSYLKEKEKRKKNQQIDFADKIKKHRLTVFYRIALAVVLVSAVGAVLFFQYRDKVYTQMTQVFTKERQEVTGAKDMALGNTVVTYSKDGVYCTDAKGNALWNQTYEMQNPMIAACKDVLAIADYNGRKVYVMNSEKKLGEVTTNMPIRNLLVAANGVVLTVQEDSKVTWIYMYDAQGKELVYFSTRMNDTGYPTAIGMSDNAKLVGIAYTYLEAGALQTRVAFYNFGDVGENQIDHLVSGFNYTDTFVPYLHFMNADTAFAVADNRLMLYGGSEVPDSRMERLTDEQIQAVYNNEKYIGLVLFNKDGEDTYLLKVLDAQGEEVVDIPFDMQSIADARILFTEEWITIYNEKECKIYSFSGKLKYEGSFEKAVRAMIPQPGSFRYMLATADSIDVVELK